MSTTPLRTIVLLFAGALGPSIVACSSPDAAARVDPIGPDQASFGPVANALGRRCGTLDCHGTPYRNLRLYGYGGLRLDPSLRPDRGTELTPSEIDANYDAVIGLEPEQMRQVVLDKGAAPERLTLVRKARGTEAHKGNGPVVIGDDADRCIVSWLASAVDTTACARVLDQP